MQILTDSYAGMNGFSAVEVDELFMVGGGSGATTGDIPAKTQGFTVSNPNGGYTTINPQNGTTFTFNSQGNMTSCSGPGYAYNTDAQGQPI